MRRITPLVAGILLTLLVGCGASSGGGTGTSSAAGEAAGRTETAKKPIVLGVTGAQTGWMSFYDKPVTVAMKLAAEKFNAEGGIDGRPIEIVAADSKSEVNLAAQAATEVLGKGAEIVITPCDFDLGAPAARTAGAKGVLALSCAGSALFGPAGAGPLAFSVGASGATQGAATAQFVTDKKWQRAYLLMDATTQFAKDWCKSFETRYGELGGRVVGRDTFQLNDQSVQAQVSRMKAKSDTFDLVAVCGFPPIGATAVKQIRAAGIEAPIIGTSGFDGPYWLSAVPNLSDMYVSSSVSVFGDDPKPAVNSFLKDYADETGKAPQAAYPIYGYAMIEMIKQAVEAIHTTDGGKLASWLVQQDDIPLILGPTHYTEKCHIALERPMRIVQYQGGQGSFAAEITPARVPIPAGCK